MGLGGEQIQDDSQFSCLSTGQMALPSTEIWVTEKEQIWGKGRKKQQMNRISDVEFEVPVGHPGGDVQQAGGNAGLELRGEVGAGDIDLGVISIWVLVITIGVDEKKVAGF